MNARQFFDKVVIARREAKAYMQDRNPEHITLFRSVVKEIDDEIERVNNILKQRKQ